MARRWLRDRAGPGSRLHVVLRLTRRPFLQMRCIRLRSGRPRRRVGACAATVALGVASAAVAHVLLARLSMFLSRVAPEQRHCVSPSAAVRYSAA